MASASKASIAAREARAVAAAEECRRERIAITSRKTRLIGRRMVYARVSQFCLPLLAPRSWAHVSGSVARV